jgi:hypothetical protein
MSRYSTPLTRNIRRSFWSRYTQNVDDVIRAAVIVGLFLAVAWLEAH